MKFSDYLRLRFACTLTACALAGGCLSGDSTFNHQAHTSARSVGIHRSKNQQTSQYTPTAKRYHDHVALLSHDALKGRGTGSHGIDLAAGYIAGQFAAAGIEPGGPDGTYFQNFTIHRDGKLQKTTTLNIEGFDVEPELRTDFVPLGFSASTKFEGDLVLVGYGITNPDQSHDDYAGINVEDKIVLMLRREPASWEVDGDATKHATFKQKATLAKQHGAVAVIIVNQSRDAEFDNLIRFRASRETLSIPVLHITRPLAEKILAAGNLPNLNALQISLDEKGEQVSSIVSGVGIKGRVDIEVDTIQGRNVVGILPGLGKHADQFVVIGAHYDHLGQRRGRIYNGADDNASGTAGVIELAKRFSATKRRDRSIIFITFAGEELGLHGSRHFAQNPTVPIKSISTMINMDMIGRLDHDDHANMLAIQGLGTGDTFKQIVNHATKKMSFRYLPDDSARGPSDHASFYDAGVPSLFFFTGIHSDYHQPGDDIEKVNVDGALEIIALVERIASKLINHRNAPQYVEVSQRANIFRGDAPTRMMSSVVMGITPDSSDDSDQEGWRIADVASGGGAAKAGMKAGDRIKAIDGTAINSFGDYLAATKDKKPGDAISVDVLRGADELTLNVTLADRSSMRRRSTPRS